MRPAAVRPSTVPGSGPAAGRHGRPRNFVRPVMATFNYNVAMTVVSIRFRVSDVHARLKASAARRRMSSSAVAEQLIDEGLRMEAHPMIVFRDGLAGRRPVIAGGPDVAEVVGAIAGGDVPVDARAGRAADLLGLSPRQVDAALAYYAEFADEIDAERRENEALAAREEALWRRRRQLLSG